MADRCRTWNIIDCGLTEIGSGHHYWEAKALTEELIRRTADVRVICHKATSPHRLPGISVLPAFSLFAYEDVSQDPTWGLTENFVVHNRTFDHDLSALDQSLFHESAVMLAMVSERQLLGAIRWLERFSDQNRPKVAMMLSGLHDEPSSASARLCQMIWRGCPDRLKRDIALCVRTVREAEMVRDVRSDAVRASPITVSFVGNARYERGCALLPDVVKLSSSLNVRFVLQVKPDTSASFDLGSLLALRAWPNVQICEAPLSRDDYLTLIANSLVLLPYHAGAYRWRHSGIYTEAKSLGAPVIVPAGTWMADDVKSCGNGLVFGEPTAESLVACIARVQQEWATLRANALRSAEAFRRQQGPERFADVVSDLLSRGSDHCDQYSGIRF